jgi:hypothetical protein
MHDAISDQFKDLKLLEMIFMLLANLVTTSKKIAQKVVE